MKVQIEVSEDQFKELLEKELADLPKEAIQTMLIESIKAYLHHEDVTETEAVVASYGVREPACITRRQNFDNLNAFLVDEEHDLYNRCKQPSQLFVQMLKDCDFSGLQDIVDDMIKDLKDNYHHILVEAVSKRLADSLINDYGFQSQMTDIIMRELNRRSPV